MRYFLFLLGALPAAGFAQVSAAEATWIKDHFGLQVEFPAHSTTQNYGRVLQTDGTYQIIPTGATLSYNDPNCHPWQDAYSILDMLPRGVWIRAAANLWEHFPTATSYGPTDYNRFQNAITGRVLYPKLSTTLDGLNLLWVLSPGIPNRNTANDGWNDDPRTRDWYVPAPTNRPSLRIQCQNFVTAVNNFSVDQARLSPGNSTVTSNIVSRIGFQMSNEVGGGHPGGSIFAKTGQWTGIGQVLEDTTNGLMWRPDNSYSKYLSGGASWTNPLTMPAFSFLTEARDQAFVNYSVVDGSVRSIQWPGSTVAGLGEVFSYYDEAFGPTQNFGWAAQCSRRAIHFRAPNIQWITSKGFPVEFVAMNSNNTFDGAWETATAYAKRWADDACLAIKGYGRLPMPAAMPITDLTECYLTYGELHAASLNPSNYAFSVGGVTKTTDQVRAEALQFGSQGLSNGNVYNAPVPPTRQAIFAAIRDELYKRQVAGTLPANFGRIYWVNGYSPDPRRETGFPNVDPINSYNPFDDFRLTTNEVKVLFGLI